jgi:hypothetical protein
MSSLFEVAMWTLGTVAIGGLVGFVWWLKPWHDDDKEQRDLGVD